MKKIVGQGGMDPISNSDRLVMLLRQKLEERAKAQRSGRTPPGAAATLQPTAVQAMAAAENADDRALRRAIVQNLLADQLDPALVNDAQFQQIVTRVTDAIAEDRDASQLMLRVIADVKSR